MNIIRGGWVAAGERLRQENLLRLMDIVRRRGSISQAELARETGLRPSTVSYLTRELKRAGYVGEVGRGTAGPEGGKPSVYLGSVPGSGAFTGVLLRGGELSTCLVDFAGNPDTPETLPLDRQSDILALLRRSVETHRKTAAARGARYLGAGIAVSSIVDPAGGVHPSAGFDAELSTLAMDLAREQDDRFVWVVENDANCTAVYWDQRLLQPNSAVMSLVFSRRPVSVGAGLLLEGKLYRGVNGGAGEILAPGRNYRADELDLLVSAAVRFADPAVVVLGVDRGDEPFPDRSYPLLAEEMGNREVGRVENPEAALLGAAYLAYQRSLPLLIERLREEKKG